jgi:16S rRNA (guanine527-N7)-methyltransferase
VIAIERPDVSVVLLEPTHKKHAFLVTAARELGLGNATPLAERLEDHAGRDYDVAVSRATWPVPEWLARAAPYVRSGGIILAMEGREESPLVPGATRHRADRGSRTRAVIELRSR